MDNYENTTALDAILGIVNSLLDGLVTLQLIYLVLKVTKLIDYSWWLVALPSFIYIGIIIIIMIIGTIVYIAENDE